MQGDGQYYHVCMGNGTEVSCRVFLIASGVCYRRIEAPGVGKLIGAGVYYGASLGEAQASRTKRYLLWGAPIGRAGGDALLPGGL